MRIIPALFQIRGIHSTANLRKQVRIFYNQEKPILIIWKIPGHKTFKAPCVYWYVFLFHFVQSVNIKFLLKKAYEILKHQGNVRCRIVSSGTEAVVWRCSVKKVFLEISQNSPENSCARASFLIMLQASG